MQALERLFNPRGIAIIGASNDPGRPGAQAMNALSQRGYAGGIYPVNPKYQELGGLKSYPAIADVPDPCDVAIVALPAAHVPAIIADCGRRGVRYAVVLGGGFRETGERGRELEAELLRVAREHEVRLVGPNCLGLVNVPDRVFAGFGSMVRPPLMQPGAVSAVIQSGGFGNSLVMRCGAAGIGFRHVVASGNETDLTCAELIDAFVDDPATRVILAYIEGVRDGRAFMAAARRARAAGKPVIVWKAGNSEQGMKAAASHTANMTGSYDIFRAAFRQCGVIEIRDIEDIVDYVRAFLAGRAAPGRRVAVMGGSGGSAVVFSDAADQHGLTLAMLSESTKTVLAQNLPGVASLDNPIDFAAGFLSDANAGRLLASLDAVLADPQVDQLALMLATVVGKPARMTADMLAQAAQRSGKPVMVFWASPRDASPEAYEILERAGIPILSSPARVARTMGVLADHALSPIEQPGDVPAGPRELPDWPDTVLDERRSKQLVAAFGVPVTQDRVFPAAPIEAGAGDLPYPVAVKIVSPDIAHKSDAGGVRLDVRDPSRLAEASRSILESVRRAAPQARLEGLLVSPMIRDGMETIVGVINDEVFGPVVAFGLGGIFAEVLKDLSYRVAPFGVDVARSMIAELRSAPMFAGVRGQSPRDVDALAAALAAVSQGAWQMRDRLQELDINPLLALPAGHGIVAVDALAVLRPAGGGAA
ncbi:acetate--CoA ligase family protein [Pigmentiphaga soli]|uniref:Acetate--CoA ligase family protein n=1 Tax=Pigmentiphaga soli TaxID=1007095 RepID=A0ABP8GXC0_9BURK